MNQDTGQSPADHDLSHLAGLVADLLDSWYDQGENQTRTGLIDQAWHASPETLMARKPSTVDENSGGHCKPGSRPPIRLDLMAHVETTLDEAREHADALGAFFNSLDGEKALRRLPALLEATLTDCRDCCRWCSVRDVKVQCGCRHRQVTAWCGRRHAELCTALGYLEPAQRLQQARCPRCRKTNSMLARKGELDARGTYSQQRVWCTNAGCGWSADGSLAILAAAS